MLCAQFVGLAVIYCRYKSTDPKPVILHTSHCSQLLIFFYDLYFVT